MANQEFHKTASQDFRPSVWAQTILLHLTKMDYPKHPPKMANQEFYKTAFQDFRPSLATNDSAPYHQNGLSKTSPENGQSRIPQNSLPRFSTIFAKTIKTRF